jgi:hypothetical protein
VALREIIDDLVRTTLPEADHALWAIADPRHPYFPIARCRLSQSEAGRYDARSWLLHPYCLKILRRELDNRDPTGGYYLRRGTTSILSTLDGGSSSSEMPAPLDDARFLKDVAFERYCDRAAMKLTALVYGMPAYHPLLKDAHARLNVLKRVFDGFPTGYHSVTPIEAQFLEVVAYEPLFLPNLSPLNRPATKDDVKAGRAVFELKGKGRLAPVRLPAVASWKKRRDAASASSAVKRLLIVQAEVDAEGKTIYGIIGDGVAHTVHPEELTDIKPIQKSFFDFLK